jgi:hypothetical protein
MAKRAWNPSQPSLFDNDEDNPPSSSRTSSTFADNLSLPVHRWFRYSAGFSALWVRETIQIAKATNKKCPRVLDPFAGSGTVLVEAEKALVHAIGVESHPFVARIAKAKTGNGNGIDANSFRAFSKELLKLAGKVQPKIEDYSPLIRKCYPDAILMELHQLRTAWLSLKDEPEGELGWLALAAILRQCSPVGTANWQYVLPKKSKARSSNPFDAYKAKAEQIFLDLAERPKTAPEPKLVQGDARSMKEVPDEWASLVITSPPYPNNFDYADATRLEMTFFGDIAGWGDLQESVRKYLVRSCTQHVSPIVGDTLNIISSPELNPIRNEIELVVDSLEKARHEHGGKKNYHTMIAAYFLDMAHVWRDLRRVTSENSRICFVIGDSAPYSIHVPVDDWMGRLAVASGFKSFSFNKTRDRNIKWKNRKHRVPLHEGQLWVEG